MWGPLRVQWGYQARPPVRRHAPQCNGGLFTWRLVDPQSPKDGRQLACPPLTSGGLALEGVICRECGDALQPTVLLLDQFLFVYGCGKKIELKSPKIHTQGAPSTCQGDLREYACPRMRKSVGRVNFQCVKGGQANWRPSLGLWGSASLQVNKPPLHCGGVPSHWRPSLVASLHSEGPSHDCGRGTRFRSRWLAWRFTSPEVGVIWLWADGWLGRRPPGPMPQL